MEEQLLKDFVATAQKYGYDYNIVMSKFPEFKGFDVQLLKDYVATTEKYNYDYSIVNSKFPEFNAAPVKKKVPSSSVGQNQGTMASSASQQQVEGILSDLQFDKETYTPQPTGSKDILSNLQSKDKAYTPENLVQPVTETKESTFDPTKYVAPEQPIVPDSEPIDVSASSATKGFNVYYNTLDSAVNSGLVKDEKEFKQKFPDMTYLSFEQGASQRKFIDAYDNLSEDIKVKIEPAVVRENGVVVALNQDLISKKDIEYLKTESLDANWWENFYFGDSEQSKLILKNVVPQQKIDYLIEEKKLYSLQESIIESKNEIERLAKNGFVEEAQSLVDRHNLQLEQYKSLSNSLNDKSILINSLEIAKDNTSMNPILSTLTSAVERAGSSVVMNFPSLAATGINLMASFPGMPGEITSMGSEVEKYLMKGAMDVNKEWKDFVPTDSDDTASNFIGDVIGQQAFVVGAAMVGGMPAAIAAGYTMSMAEMYEESINNGLSHDNAMYLSKIYGMVSAPLELLPVENIINRATGDALKKEIIQQVLKYGAEGFTKEIAEQAVKLSFKPIIKEGLKEAAAEGVQESAQYMLSKGLAEAYNEYIKEDGEADFKKADLGSKEFLQELGQNFILGSAGGFIGGTSMNILQGNVYTGTNYKAIESMLLDPKQLSKINDQLTAYRKNGTIETDEDLEIAKQQIGILQESAAHVERATKAMPETFGIEQQKRTFALVSEKISIEKEIEGMMPILAETKKAQIEEIDNKIRDIASGKITEADLISQKKTTVDAAEEQAAPQSGVVGVETVAEEQSLKETPQADGEPTSKISPNVDKLFEEDVTETSEKISGNLARNKSKNFELSKISQSVVDAATKAGKAIETILPKTRIVLHDTDAEFNKFYEGKDRGLYDSGTNTIHINLSKANKRTVSHEVFHAIVYNNISNEYVLSTTKDMYNSVKRSLATSPSMKRKLTKFSKAYEEDFQNDEFVAELFGYLASEFKQLDAPVKVKIKQWVNNIATKFGLSDIIKLTEQDLSDLETIEMLNTLSSRVSKGETITEEDIESLDNGTNPIGSPTEIIKPTIRQSKINFKDSYENSLVTPDKKIDFDALLNEIVDKKLKVWFWVADQLGINKKLGIDGGPSFAHQNPNDIWASSMSVKGIKKNIDESDYLFIISGSPTISKLFSKSAYDLLTSKLGDFPTFKKDALESNPVKDIKEVLEAHDSWESLRNDSSTNTSAKPATKTKDAVPTKIGTGRKKFLVALNNSQNTPNASFTKYVQSINGYTDLNTLRDGFYVENDFKQNDIMLVLKPTGARAGSNHSTYENTVEGEVIGVPDIKVDALQIMPKDMADKYSGDSQRAKASQAIAPYGSGRKNITRKQKENETGKIQPKRTGDGRERRTEGSAIKSLQGSPTVQGATGPDPRLVSVAEKYAAENGIDFKRQSEYVEVDENRAKRLADEYAKMTHDPKNPKVKEAYSELIKQTKAQYQALVDAGYQFWFIDLNDAKDIEYISSPYNAMRDLRKNKEMGVFPTEAGFGTDESIDVSESPLLERTGIEWALGGLEGEMMPVTANDLFRAVHDTFGHGLEGAGFRARGEENAWQAHVRLFTGPAIGAITTETRGQNSWVNYGPNGEQNRTASSEDTIFADQKTGLMPSWTWNEGRAGDEVIREQKIPVATQNRITGIIVRLKKKIKNPNEIAKKVIANVQSRDPWYINEANDTEREYTIRFINKLLGLKSKAAPTANKILGKIKEIKQITYNEQQALVDQLTIAQELGNRAKAIAKEVANNLNEELNNLAKNGKITVKQAVAIINRLNKVDLLMPSQVENFVDYMAKILNNADYFYNIGKIKKMLPSVKKNLKRGKIGASNVYKILDRLASVEPQFIPINVLEDYISLMEMFSTRAAELTLEEERDISEKADMIMQEIEIQNSLVSSLSDIYAQYVSENEVGSKKYSEILDEMVSKKIITEEDKKVMLDYKTTIVPSAKKEAKSDAQIEEERKAVIAEIKENAKDGMPMGRFALRDERVLVAALKKLINTDGINELSINDLRNLLKVVNNINNGFVSNTAQNLKYKLNAENRGKMVLPSFLKGALGGFTKGYSKFKKAVTFSERGVAEIALRSIPKYYMDQALGDFKSRNVFDAILKTIAQAEQLYLLDTKSVRERLETAKMKVFKSLGRNPNSLNKSSAKQMFYMIQLEYLSNSDKTKVKEALDYLNKTIALNKIPDRHRDMLIEIRNEFAPDGKTLDIKKMYDSFNEAEKESIKLVQDINKELADKAIFASAVIRGNRIDLIENYVHHVVVDEEFDGINISDGKSLADTFNESRKPSTKAKSFIERTNSITALNFDIYNSAQRGAKNTLLDYHLTEPIVTSRMVMKNVEKRLKDAKVFDENKDLFNSINDLLDNTIKTLLFNNSTSTDFIEDVVQQINKAGYQAVLVSSKRFISEAISNLSFAMWKGRAYFIEGIKHYDTLSSKTGVDVMKAVKSLQIARVYPNAEVSSRYIDAFANETANIKGSKNKSAVANNLSIINNYTLKPAKNFADNVANAVLSTPDKALNRPLWFGAFATEFKKQTGQDVDFERIAAQDEAYMSKYEEAIAKSSTIADDISIEAGASEGLFTGISKGKDWKEDKNQYKAIAKFVAYNYNNYMNRFMVYEYQSFVKGLQAAMGNGMITEKEGRQLMAAVTTRMTMYSFLANMMGNGFLEFFKGLFGFEEPDDEKSWAKKLGQASLSTVSSLFLGRNFGNIARSIINYAVEIGNEKYLDALRDGDYDKYKDALVYAPNLEDKSWDVNMFPQWQIALAGPYAQSAKVLNLGAKVFLSPEKETYSAQERAKKEMYYRLPIEAASAAGILPAAKEFQNAINNYIYADLKRANSNQKEKIEDALPEKE